MKIGNNSMPKKHSYECKIQTINRSDHLCLLYFSREKWCKNWNTQLWSSLKAFLQINLKVFIEQRQHLIFVTSAACTTVILFSYNTHSRIRKKRKNWQWPSFSLSLTSQYGPRPNLTADLFLKHAPCTKLGTESMPKNCTCISARKLNGPISGLGFVV